MSGTPWRVGTPHGPRTRMLRQARRAISTGLSWHGGEIPTASMRRAVGNQVQRLHERLGAPERFERRRRSAAYELIQVRK